MTTKHKIKSTLCDDKLKISTPKPLLDQFNICDLSNTNLLIENTNANEPVYDDFGFV